ncbi:T9SS type A sorting domain-containing protein [Salibacter halophilus]|uniref:T9SS type A sorting domain-containing protein n=1 Tax=Salibacter halophilus TaxID=1803916 RepID=A0A6N6M6X2_9FLAO|nr:T9SS type A sorting domain-containing protein [Salibacter halophilus]KAB1065548.1 T9SS type A sorting domain-containing protein [Salibacter halophilus]
MNSISILKILLCSAIAFFSSASVYAQPSYDWVKQFDYSFNDHAKSMAIDDSNYIYFTGKTDAYGSIDGPFITKADSTNILWTFIPDFVNTIDEVEALKIRVDTAGDIYVLLEFDGFLKFGNDTISSTPDDLNLIKLTDSTLIWHKQFPIGDSYELWNQFEIDRAGNCYVMSNYENTEVFGSDTLTSVGSTDIFISKIRSNGQFQWTRSFGSSSNRRDVSKGLSLDSLANIYGYFSKTYLSSNGDGASFIVKIDSSGQVLKNERITGFDPTFFEIHDFTTSQSGTSYILLRMGSNTPHTILKDTTISFNHHGHVILMYDSSINYEDRIVILDTSNPVLFHPSVIDVSNENMITIGGLTHGQYKIGPDTVDTGLFLLNYDPMLAYNWSKVFATSTYTNWGKKITDLTTNEKHLFFLCNTYLPTVDFDSLTITSSINNNDTYYGKLKNDSVYCLNNSGSNLSITSCLSYRSPTGNHTWTSSGLYTDTLTNIRGCDSILYINLTINTNNTFSNISDTTCHSYTSPSGKYTWTNSGIYQDTVPNNGGCDSIITIDLSIIKSTRDTLTIVECDSYLSPSGNYLWASSGVYQDIIPNAAGCDSIITIDLTINDGSSTLADTTCNNYTSPSGKYTWNTSGVYLDTLPDAAGCDSILTIVLSVLNSINNSVTNNSPTLVAELNSASYQWLDCNNGFSIINGDTNQSFTATSNGSYAVEVSKHGCIDTSICYTVNSLSIANAKFDNQVNIFPNPTYKNLNVDLGKTYDEISLIIKNTLGQMIFFKKYNSKRTVQANINGEPGLYLIEVRTKKNVSTYKIIKER